MTSSQIFVKVTWSMSFIEIGQELWKCEAVTDRQTHTRTHKHTHTQTHTNKHTNTHTHTHTHTHTDTDTHTHTQLWIGFLD